MSFLDYIYSFIFPTVYASNSAFFDDYPKMEFSLFKNQTISNSVVTKVNEVFGGWYHVLKAVWILMLSFSLITFVLSLARMAVHSSDNPLKKDGYKHDLMLSLILLAIMGGMPVIFIIIINILAGTF